MLKIIITPSVIFTIIYIKGRRGCDHVVDYQLLM
jgi:hypothetical protein